MEHTSFFLKKILNEFPNYCRAIHHAIKPWYENKGRSPFWCDVNCIAFLLLLIICLIAVSLITWLLPIILTGCRMQCAGFWAQESSSWVISNDLVGFGLCVKWLTDGHKGEWEFIINLARVVYFVFCHELAKLVWQISWPIPIWLDVWTCFSVSIAAAYEWRQSGVRLYRSTLIYFASNHMGEIVAVGANRWHGFRSCLEELKLSAKL